ncbi:MAG: PilZ domain-containing protein [Pseudobdellovibrionaceae bacterium]|nr:PilZ domain-containing protein [Bdellovibrionales bacterium]USN46443.1 MAG: PilZ domain-containing protein [Pseudobdellovibrionaceae bacterium]
MIWGKKKKSNVVVKKVAPYPIEAVLIGDKGPQSVSIPHLAVRGCLIKLPEATLRVGQIFEIRFRIPVFNLEIVEAVKVVKVYIRYSGGAKSGNFDPLTANMSEEPAETEAETDSQGRSSSTAQAPQPGPEDGDQSEDENDTVEAPVGGDHMAELHFVSLLPENKRKIQAFLVRIGQL